MTAKNVANGQPFDVYQTGGSGNIRIWKQDGFTARNSDEVGKNGDYIAAGKAYVANNIFPGTTSTGNPIIYLYIEGINESNPGSVRIKVTFKPSGTGASATDAVRCTVAHFESFYRRNWAGSRRHESGVWDSANSCHATARRHRLRRLDKRRGRRDSSHAGDWVAHYLAVSDCEKY